MREVSEEEFYNVVGPQDVILSTRGNFPYTTLYLKRHSGSEVGRSVETYTDGIENQYPIVIKYFLSK